MHNIANYDVTTACGYVGYPLNGFKNPLVCNVAAKRHISGLSDMSSEDFKPVVFAIFGLKASVSQYRNSIK